MRLQNLVASIVIGVTCLTSQTYAENIQARTLQKAPISSPEKKEDSRDNYCINREAILSQEEEILEKIKIRYKK